MKPIHVFLLVCACVLGGMTCCDSGGGDIAKTDKQAAEKAVAEKASSTSEAVEEPPADKPAAEKASNTSEAEGESQPRELTNSIGMKLVFIPPGEFMMGSPEDEEGRLEHEGPQHRVKITKGFYMGATEVTQAQWKAVMGNNPSSFKGDNLPVENVSWNGAMDFCRKLSAMEGKTYRLPTEAEWEYACRAGSTGPYAGTGKLDDMGWYRDNSGDKTHAVATKQANAWGLYDMHGNVWEWCQSQYKAYPYREDDGRESFVDKTGLRVLRGGCWSYSAFFCRVSYRIYFILPTNWGSTYGFRCARTLE